MNSPFPGMDPYLETHWRDVHTSLMTYIRDQLQDQLPLDLVARVEESVSVDVADESRLIAPDVRITEDFASAEPAVSRTSAAVAEPLVVLEEIPQTARHVKIVDLSSGERVITVIEVLSPTNKLTTTGREEYRRKQREYLLGDVNLVEVDLLRCGRHVLSAAWEMIPPDKRRTYMMSVRGRTRTAVFGASLREPLPVISIPLRPQDDEIQLNLQQLMTQVYDRGRYWKLNYQTDPEPPLSPEDAAWVDALLRANSRRN